MGAIITYVCSLCRGRGYLPTTATIPPQMGRICPQCNGEGQIVHVGRKS